MTVHEPERRLRVTLYSDALYFGGAEMYLALLARHLDPARVELQALLPADGGASRLREAFAAAGARIAAFPRPGRSWPGQIPAMIRRFQALPGDVLHMNLPSAYDAGASSVAFAARHAGYRRVVSTEQLPMIERKYRQVVPKVFFSHWIDAIIVNSRENRDILVHRHRMDREKVRIVPNGVESPAPFAAAERSALRGQFGLREGEIAIGIVGALTARKGHRFLLGALARLLSRGDAPPFRLLVAGEGEERASLEAQTAALGLSDRVVFLGPRPDAARLMQLFDLFVLPSLIEQQPFTILEAMAAGLPVVSSAIFAIPELVEEGRTGLLLAPGDEIGLANAIHRLLADPAARAAFGRAGRARFEALFTAERMTRDTLALYTGAERSARPVLEPVR